ncbi:unnamed protein product, partial [Prorocentrum cordatum]
MDPVLERNRPLYLEFIKFGISRGVFTLGKERVEDVSAFFVAKKGERIRSALDCRRSNQRFQPPPPPPSVNLFSAAGFADLEVPKDAPLYFAGVDVQSAFYQHKLPAYLRSHFCMPKVTAGELGVSRLDGRRVPPRACLYPQLAVVPMGWSWALFFAQKAHERTLGQSDALRLELRAVDFAPTPCPLKEPTHPMCADNVLAVGTDRAAVTEVRRAASQALEGAGLAVHEGADAAESMMMLGVQLEGRSARATLAPRRFWKLYMGLGHLAQRRPRVTSRDIERVIGHCTFAALCRRESLSCFSAVYSFVQQRYQRARPLWASARCELRIFRRLLIALSSDLDAEWSTKVVMTDACETGRASVVGEWELSEVQRAGRRHERRRFRHAREDDGGWSRAREGAGGRAAPGAIWRATAARGRQLRHRRCSAPGPEGDSRAGASWSAALAGTPGLCRPAASPPPAGPWPSGAPGDKAAEAQRAGAPPGDAGPLRRLAPRTLARCGSGPLGSPRRSWAGRSLPSAALAAPRDIPTSELPRSAAAVGRRSRMQCTRLLELFLRRSRLKSLAGPAADAGAAPAKFFDDLYLEGEIASTGEKVLAAIFMHVPDYQSKGKLALPRAYRALRGWRLLRPSRTRRPLPRATCMGVARQLWRLSGRPDLAVLRLLMVDAYLRPGEAFRLTRGQIIPPRARMPKVTIHINPDYMKRPSKTGEMDEPVDAARPWRDSLLVRLAQGPPSSSLWSFTAAEAKDMFERAVRELNLDGMMPVLYTARHSRASNDRFTGGIALQEVQRRGRWRQPSSVRRYEKRGLIQTVWSQMEPSARTYCLRAEAELPSLLAAAS